MNLLKSFMKDMGWLCLINSLVLLSPKFREWMDSMSVSYKHMSRDEIKETLGVKRENSNNTCSFWRRSIASTQSS